MRAWLAGGSAGPRPPRTAMTRVVTDRATSPSRTNRTTMLAVVMSEEWHRWTWRRAVHFGILACMPLRVEQSTSARELATLVGPVEDVPGPRYAGLARRIRELVTTGALPSGSRLPAERELAAALGTSRVTVASAYRQLREAGFAVT